MQRIGLLIFCILVSFLPSLSAVWIGPGEWYDSLVKPSFNPPKWIFPVAWTFLYTLIGIAWYLFLISAYRWEEKIKGYVFFGMHLLLNALWTPLFFGWHWIGIALIDLSLLWVVIVFMVMTFHKYSRPAGWLLTPYLLWVSFAGILNTSLLILNNLSST